MIKNVLKRRRECGTYLATDHRRPQCRLKATLFISLLHLESPAMSTGSSQVGAHSLLLFNTFFIFLIHFLSLYLFRFSFYFNIYYLNIWGALSSYVSSLSTHDHDLSRSWIDNEETFLESTPHLMYCVTNKFL